MFILRVAVLSAMSTAIIRITGSAVSTSTETSTLPSTISATEESTTITPATSSTQSSTISTLSESTTTTPTTSSTESSTISTPIESTTTTPTTSSTQSSTISTSTESTTTTPTTSSTQSSTISTSTESTTTTPTTSSTESSTISTPIESTTTTPATSSTESSTISTSTESTTTAPRISTPGDETTTTLTETSSSSSRFSTEKRTTSSEISAHSLTITAAVNTENTTETSTESLTFSIPVDDISTNSTETSGVYSTITTPTESTTAQTTTAPGLCTQQPCVNGGVCVDQPGDFLCTCTVGFTGKTCNKTVVMPPKETQLKVKIFPDRGPQAGGTNLTISIISGITRVENVLLKSSPSTYIECKILHRYTDKVIAETPAYDEVVTFEVVLIIETDGVKITWDAGHQFRYKPNPAIQNIQPNATLVGGGTKLTVSGSSIDAVATPKILFGVENCKVINQQAKFKEPCLVNNTETMFCMTPNVSECIIRKSQSTATTPSSIDEVKLSLSIIGFILDGDSNYKDIKEHPELPSVVVAYAPPELIAQNSTVQYRKGEPLEIRGKHMKRGVTAGDYTVYVGEEECLISSDDSLLQSVLFCTPPAPIPQKSNISNSNYHRITVNIGNYKYYYGEMRYPFWTHPAFIPGVTVVGVLLVITITTSAIVNIRRNRPKQQVDRDSLIVMPSVITEEMEDALNTGRIYLPPVRVETENRPPGVSAIRMANYDRLNQRNNWISTPTFKRDLRMTPDYGRSFVDNLSRLP